MVLSHKTKTVQFLGRTTPIVLQNDNGPCPLLAICNVLLLKNCINLHPDVAEVSQEELLTLVADRLIDSNCNVDDKDYGCVENQLQNIVDAYELLPQLATGIDVNIKFTRIDAFEFTRERAIFAILDIPLYHGWIVDPQDLDTANAIGLKSYNTLMGELVALETINMENEQKEKNIHADSVDFIAATTANLGIPSPSLSRARSFDEPPKAPSDHYQSRRGDMEEEAELLLALKLSEANTNTSANDSPSVTINEHTEPEREVTSNEAVNIRMEQANEHEVEATASFNLAKTSAESDSSGGRRQDGDLGEVYQDRERMYEGEVVLAKQGDGNTEASSETSLGDQVSSKQGEIINIFLKNSASQLTVYGLFCLQDGVKERELCVFFRNNHFNTMFKFEGELYILATDQGYLDQPDLVWEKLNEVNGNTVFMTSSFKEFKVETQENISWDAMNAVTSTTDYIASIDDYDNPNSSFNSDLQLAIALQQQEFEQQQPQRNVQQQQPVTTSSRLVTGPEVSIQTERTAEVSPRQESKSPKASP